MAPDGRPVVYFQNIQGSINSILFYCASKPGLSRVLMKLYDFEGEAVRCRYAYELRGGPENKVGWFVGKKMREALLLNCWDNGILLGVDAGISSDVEDKEEGKTGDDSKAGISNQGSTGLMGDPERSILYHDTLIFVSVTSSPCVTENSTNFGDEVAPYLDGALQAIKSAGSVTAASDEPLHLLICGWRSEWDEEMSTFKERLRDIAAGMALGSSITCTNVKSSVEFGALLEGSVGWASCKFLMAG